MMAHRIRLALHMHDLLLKVPHAYFPSWPFIWIQKRYEWSIIIPQHDEEIVTLKLFCLTPKLIACGYNGALMVFFGNCNIHEELYKPINDIRTSHDLIVMKFSGSYSFYQTWKSLEISFLISYKKKKFYFLFKTIGNEHYCTTLNNSNIFASINHNYWEDAGGEEGVVMLKW